MPRIRRCLSILPILTLSLLLCAGLAQPQQTKTEPLAKLENVVFLPVAIEQSDTPTTPMANLANSDFEAGPGGGWTESSTVLGSQAGVIISPLYDTSILAPRSGRYVAWLGGVHTDLAILSQPILLAEGAARLEYAYRAYSEETACDADAGEIALLRGSEVHVLAAIELCLATEREQWTIGQIDLTPYSGQAWTLRIQVETNASLFSHLFLDDIRIVQGGQ
jgi:hypothetical protein